MYDKLEINKTGTMAKVNGTPFKLVQGYDAVKHVQKLEIARSNEYKKYLEVIEQIKDGASVKTSMYDGIIANIRMYDKQMMETLEAINESHIDQVDDDIMAKEQERSQLIKHLDKYHISKASVQDIIKLTKSISSLYEKKNTIFKSTFVEIHGAKDQRNQAEENEPAKRCR